MENGNKRTGWNITDFSEDGTGKVPQPPLVGFLNVWYVCVSVHMQQEWDISSSVWHAVMEMLIGLFDRDVALKKPKKPKKEVRITLLY